MAVLTAAVDNMGETAGFTESVTFAGPTEVLATSEFPFALFAGTQQWELASDEYVHSFCLEGVGEGSVLHSDGVAYVSSGLVPVSWGLATEWLSLREGAGVGVAPDDAAISAITTSWGSWGGSIPGSVPIDELRDMLAGVTSVTEQGTDPGHSVGTRRFDLHLPQSYLLGPGASAAADPEALVSVVIGPAGYLERMTVDIALEGADEPVTWVTTYDGYGATIDPPDPGSVTAVGDLPIDAVGAAEPTAGSDHDPGGTCDYGATT